MLKEPNQPVPRDVVEEAADTDLARAQYSTLRLKLLKIGARIKVTARRIRLSFSQAYPYAKTFAQVLANLQQESLWNPSG